jgi:hypothetical protein
LTSFLEKALIASWLLPDEMSQAPIRVGGVFMTKDSPGNTARVKRPYAIASVCSTPRTRALIQFGMLLEEIGSNRHLSLLGHLRIAVEDRSYGNVRE